MHQGRHASTPDAHHRQTRIIAGRASPDTHQRRTRNGLARTHQLFYRASNCTSCGPRTHINAGRASRLNAHQGRTRIKAERHQGQTRIKAEHHQGRTPSRPNAHQRRTRIKAVSMLHIAHRLSTPDAHQRRTRIKPGHASRPTRINPGRASTPDAHQARTRIKADTHQHRTRISCSTARPIVRPRRRPSLVRLQSMAKAVRPRPSTPKAVRQRSPYASPALPRVRLHVPWPADAHQRWTRIKAKRARPNMQGQTCKAECHRGRTCINDARASTPHVHQVHPRRRPSLVRRPTPPNAIEAEHASTTHAHQRHTRINAARASTPNVQGQTCKAKRARAKAERHRGRTRMNAAHASTPDAHQRRTCKAEHASRPNVQGRTCKA